jgi:imidazolonepropionase-like amidohydrolase
MASVVRHSWSVARGPSAVARFLTAMSLLVVAATFTYPTVAARQMPIAPVYAIQGAKIVTGTATIEKGTLVMRNGLIEDVGANAAVPADAIVVDGANMTVYPGLIDMTNTAAVEAPRAAAAAGAGPEGAPDAPAQGAGRGGRAGNAGPAPTWADADRAKREALLNPDYDAASHVRYDGIEMQRLAAAGITTVLAVPPAGLLRGESALVNVVAPPDEEDVSRVGGYRRSAVVIASPVAQHVSFAGRAGGPGYPAALLGEIAFVRQAFYDAKWQKDARVWADKHKDQPRPGFDPALDALGPALDRKMPVSFEAGELREILRALAMAKEFNLDPIVTGGIEADEAVADLKAANARVILTLAAANAQAGRGGGRGGNDTPIRITRMQQKAPKVAAALEKAGIPYAFSSEGLQTPAEFVRGVARAVREGGLTEEQAVRALTVNAAKMAGASDRVGTLAKGRIANAVVVEGSLFSDQARVRRVFVDGRPVNIDVPASQQQGGGRRGGQ